MYISCKIKINIFCFSPSHPNYKYKTLNCDIVIIYKVHKLLILRIVY